MAHRSTLTAAALVSALVFVALAAAEAPPPDAEMKRKQAAEEGLAAGTMLGADNWKLADGMLPPEVLRHYEKGEYKVVLTNRRDARRFAGEIGFLGRKQEKLLRELAEVPEASSALSHDHVPFLAGYVRSQPASCSAVSSSPSAGLP